jgi:hypothetical protein
MLPGDKYDRFNDHHFTEKLVGGRGIWTLAANSSNSRGDDIFTEQLRGDIFTEL